MRRLGRLTACLLALLTLWVAFAPMAQAQDMTVLRDTETEDMLKTFTLPIFEAAGLTPENVHFILIQSDDMNSFVAGGQNIFIYSGLVLAADNPAELVGVLAHETGHIADGHIFRTTETVSDLTFQSILASLAGIAIAIGTHNGEAAMAAVSASSTLTNQLYLRHSRTQEASADRAGATFLERAGLPVTGFLSFMEKLESQESLPPSEQVEFLQTHPLTQNRIDFLKDVVAHRRTPGHIPKGWDEMFARVKAKLQGYLYPERALQNTGTSVAARYGRVMGWYRTGKIDKSLAALDTLLAQEPKNPYFLELKGQILFESGKIAQAAPIYAAAVKAEPGAGLIRTAYAHTLLEMNTDTVKNRTEAIRQLKIALRTEPRLPLIHHLLATAYGQNGEQGLSYLHMADEALLENDKAFAKEQALRAKAILPRDSAGWLRADDILNVIRKNTDREKNVQKQQ